MRFLSTIAVVISVVLLAACESGLDQRYLDVAQGQSLELPPDLADYEAESKFELPAAFNGDDAARRNKIPVLAKVDSLRLESGSGLYWLSVSEPVDNLYQMVKNFWAAEGYSLVLDEPVIGVMQTEWIFREQGGRQAYDSWWKSLFAADDLSASQDQFKTRIERVAQGQSSLIYIAHRGTEYKHVLQAGDKPLREDEDNQWRFRRPEPELEIEMLSRLMIYLGLQQSQVEQQQANLKLFSPRAFMHIDADENSPFLIIKDAYPLAWNRVYHQIERMNFQIDSAEFKSGFSGEGFIAVSTEVVNNEESGFFSFSSNEPENKLFTLVFSEETHDLTRVIIETEKGDYDTSPEGNEFLTLLYQQVK